MSRSRASVVSSYTIIKGSLIEETYVVFQNWDFSKTTTQNFNTMQHLNLISSKSMSWLRDVRSVLHRRFDPEGRDRSLVELARQGCSMDVWKPLMLWHMTRDEFLLRDFLINWCYPKFIEGVIRLRAEDVVSYLNDLHDQKIIPSPWKESTLKRVSAQLLHIAQDFGILRGKLVREFESSFLPEDAFIYLLHAMMESQPNAHEIVQSEDWHMFLMDAADVERELFRLHQFRRVHYEVAGSLAQLKLPCGSAADYAWEMVA